MKVIEVDKSTVIHNLDDQFMAYVLYGSDEYLSVREWISKTMNLNYEARALMIDDKIVALASFSEASDYRMNTWKEVMAVYVHPEYKDLKYGSTLIRSILDRKEDRGYENTYFWVMEEDLEARKFIERQNIIPNGNRDRRIINNQSEEFLRYVYVNL